jgi:hypothetical protein
MMKIGRRIAAINSPVPLTAAENKSNHGRRLSDGRRLTSFAVVGSCSGKLCPAAAAATWSSGAELALSRSGGDALAANARLWFASIASTAAPLPGRALGFFERQAATVFSQLSGIGALWVTSSSTRRSAIKIGSSCMTCARMFPRKKGGLPVTNS